MSRIRRVSAVLVRTALILLIAGMLAGASTVRKSSKLAAIGVIDVSGSVKLFGEAPAGPDGSGGRPADALAAARGYLDKAFAGRGAEDLAGIVVFDGRAL